MSAMKKIGMVLKSNFPPDIRVEKEAKSLIAAGHEVYVLCNREAGKPEYEVWSDIHVCRLMPARSIIGSILGLLFFRHPKIKKSICEFTSTFAIDVLHVHDLPLANTSISAAKLKKIPVVLDFHENYPAAVEVWRAFDTGPKRWLLNLISSRKRWLKDEKKAVQAANQVIVVVDEMKDTLVKRANVSPEKIHVITNTESKAFGNCCLVGDDLESRFDGFFTLLYSGGIGPHRGIDTVIKALSHIRQKIPNIRLVLVGTGSANVMNYLRKLAKDDNVEDLIFWDGWQPFAKMSAYMKACDVGLVPHNYNEHTDNTIPHKIFQHMMMGQPIIVSSCRPLARIVNETKAGALFEADSPQSLAASVTAIFQNQELRTQMGKNGIKATLEGPYMWEKTAINLCSLYQTI